MDLRDLVDDLQSGDLLSARQWVKDAYRAGVLFTDLPRPQGLDAQSLAAAASLAELLSGRAGQLPPPWTAEVPPAPEDVWLDRALERIPFLRERCLTDSPPALKRRNVYALPDFLSVP